ncbi:MAG: 3-isopropylmalate dehydratase small subunit, partial [Chitinophagaceae bacterium]|nr:3-isopropylmalate dehydratase small subunit [Chitinophagaceae bacterium]
VSDAFLQRIFLQDNNTELTVNLEKQTITINSTGEQEHFEINNYKKTCLLNGYDDIDYLLSIKEDIQQFETQRV